MKRKSGLTADEGAPSPRDIVSACRKIQSGWTDHERRKRAGLPKHEAWNPPTIRSNQMGGDVELESEA